MLRLYNTLSRKKEEFKPLKDNLVGLYTCGPTVYNYAHIGNLRTYIFEDVLKRTLTAAGYEVNHVMNITDVGHLTDDADNGEDKMEKGARREGKSAWDIAEYYTKAFQKDMKALNIEDPSVWCKATDHIPEQIALVQTLIDKGYTYCTNDGIYFDTQKLDDYGKLANLKKQKLKAGARVDMGEKKHPQDFALWKFTPSGEKRQMQWDAFGKTGFPGWHIECSAMSMKYLGAQFDIHCGGIDHIPVHHTNEIAQSEAATGKKPWVNYWMHGEFLTMNEEKMAKSGENFITLQTIIQRGISPLAYRYFVLQTHYRKPLTFSFEALEAAQSGLNHLRSSLAHGGQKSANNHRFEEHFLEKMFDDLNTPEALSLLWELAKSDSTIQEKQAIASRCDNILGLDLHKQPLAMPKDIPSAIQELLNEREQARKRKNWKESDRLRDKILAEGFLVEDTSEGQRVIKK